MTLVVRCRDIGFDCEGIVRAESEEELLQQVGKHAGSAWNYPFRVSRGSHRQHLANLPALEKQVNLVFVSPAFTFCWSRYFSLSIPIKPVSGERL